MDKIKINIGIIGCGNIGQGLIKVIEQSKDKIVKKTGIALNIKYLCDKRKLDIKGYSIVDDYKKVIADKDIDVIVELIGGINPAYDIIKQALKNKKNVVTANKALLAEHYKELFMLAEENDVQLRYEASVAGCIPIIRSLNRSLSANEIEEIYGILNGTTNFILTRMEEGMEFDKALKLAQKQGFAEPDPSFDISGKDSMQKLTILTMLGFNVESDHSKIFVEGIDHLKKTDIVYAAEMGYKVKLLAIGKNKEKKIEARVHPVLIPKSHILADVKDELNAVFVKGNFIGKQMYYGKGAGPLPTGSIIAADIVDIALSKEGKKKLDKKEHINIDDIETTYYIRFTVKDKAGVLSKITKILAEKGISISSVVQKEEGKNVVPLVMITHKTKEKLIKEAISIIDKLDVVEGKSIVIRIEGEI